MSCEAKEGVILADQKSDTGTSFRNIFAVSSVNALTLSIQRPMRLATLVTGGLRLSNTPSSSVFDDGSSTVPVNDRRLFFNPKATVGTSTPKDGRMEEADVSDTSSDINGGSMSASSMRSHSTSKNRQLYSTGLSDFLSKVRVNFALRKGSLAAHVLTLIALLVAACLGGQGVIRQLHALFSTQV